MVRQHLMLAMTDVIVMLFISIDVVGRCYLPMDMMAVGLAKACVPGKKCSVPEKTEFIIENQTEWEVYIHLNIK